MNGQKVTVQDYAPALVLASHNVTNAFVAVPTVIGFPVAFNGTTTYPEGGVHLQNQLELYIAITLTTATSITIKLEFSADNATYFQESSSAIAAGVDTVSQLTHVFSATGNYRLALPIKDRYVKISYKANATDAASFIAINAIVGTV